MDNKELLEVIFLLQKTVLYIVGSCVLFLTAIFARSVALDLTHQMYFNAALLIITIISFVPAFTNYNKTKATLKDLK